MAYFRALTSGSSGGTSDVEATHGTFTYATSMSNTFDCGLNEPDLIYVKETSTGSTWSALYANITGFVQNYSYSSNTHVFTNNTVSISGSNVTITSLFANGRTYEYYVCKLNS